MVELEDRNPEHQAIKRKICEFCGCPDMTVITKTALNDLGIEGISKKQVLSELQVHISGGRRVFTDRMDNNDVAYIAKECVVCGVVLFVKVKFQNQKGREVMVVMSAHPPRKW